MTPGVHQDEDRLLELAYGELPAHEASAVEAHVRGCARCAASLEQIRKVRATMKQLTPVSAPDAGLESLLAYAEQTAKRNAAGPSRAAPWWRRFLAPVASVAALALVVVVTYKNQDDLEAPSPAAVAVEAQRKREAEQTKTANSRSSYEEGKSALAEEAAMAPPPVAAAPVGGETAAKDSADLDQTESFGLGDAVRKAGKLGTKGEVTTSDKKSLDDGRIYAQKAKAPAKPSKMQPADDGLMQALGNGSGASVATEKADAPKANAAPPPAAAPSPVVAAKPAPVADDYSNAAQRGAPKASSRALARPEAPAAEERAAPAQQQGWAPSGPSSASGSMGLSMGGGKSASTGRAEKEVSAAAKGEAMRDAEDDRAAANNQKLVEAELAKARAAGNASDRQGEVKHAMAALDSGATGYQRAEALKRLCDALEALGEPGSADRYCDLLLRDFPSTAAARAVADRRNRVQRAAPAPAAKKALRSDEYDAPAEAKPDKAPASSKPAQAY